MAKPAAVDAERLLKVGTRLGEAVIDPGIWPQIMAEISAAACARGAVLLQGDVRTGDVPRTAGVDAYIQSYFTEEWHQRDVRAERAVPRLLRGEKVIIDQDIVTPEEMQRVGLYAESLLPHGLQWFAGIGFFAGATLWGLTIQRTPAEGPFDPSDKRALGALAQRLTETATLSKAVGGAVLTGITNALDLVGQPVLALDRRGLVIDANAAAEPLFDDDIRIDGRRLLMRDQRARSELDALVDRMRATPDSAALPRGPIVVQRRNKQPLLMRILPIDGAARSPFLGARALLLLADLDRRSGPQPAVLAQTLGLTPAEAKVATLLAEGKSVEEIALAHGITENTVRMQLKSIFAKTGTRRQGELIALLARI
jgi:DNA-binding CsgD family transcriptional regulator